MWKMFGEWMATADFGNKRVYQKFIPTNNIQIKGVRTYVIFYNTPTLTSFNMKLYANVSGAPGGLIATSTNAPTKASIITLSHGVKEIYFDFNNIPLVGGETYHFCLDGTGYTGTTSSHVAWKHSFPDPAYQTNVDMSREGAYVSPFDITIIGSE